MPIKHLVRGFGVAGILALTALSTPSLADEGHTATPGKTFRDCDKCPEMVVIPSGTVLGGNPKDFADEPNGGAAVRPKVVVQKPFAIGKYEVTQSEWDAAMDSNPSNNKGPTLPVEQITWKDTQEYIRRLNAKTGKHYRLPSEAEWEFAARANSAEPYTYGTDEAALKAHAWFRDNAEGKTHPVGQLKPNAFGVYDMLGNAWEWIEDCYGANLTSSSPEYFTKEWPKVCYRVIRGGSIENIASAATLFSRASLKQVNHNINVGFRVAHSVP